MHVSFLLLVIRAQIATEENLESTSTIEFPSSDSSSDSNFMIFGNMAPMIQMPSSVIINRINKEGVCVHVTNVEDTTCIEIVWWFKFYWVLAIWEVMFINKNMIYFLHAKNSVDKAKGCTTKYMCTFHEPIQRWWSFYSHVWTNMISLLGFILQLLQKISLKLFCNTLLLNPLL